MSGALSLLVGSCALLLARLSPPLHGYTATQNVEFAKPQSLVASAACPPTSSSSPGGAS